MGRIAPERGIHSHGHGLRLGNVSKRFMPNVKQDLMVLCVPPHGRALAEEEPLRLPHRSSTAKNRPLPGRSGRDRSYAGASAAGQAAALHTSLVRKTEGGVPGERSRFLRALRQSTQGTGRRVRVVLDYLRIAASSMVSFFSKSFQKSSSVLRQSDPNFLLNRVATESRAFFHAD